MGLMCHARQQTCRTLKSFYMQKTSAASIGLTKAYIVAFRRLYWSFHGMKTIWELLHLRQWEWILSIQINKIKWSWG